MLPAIRLEVVDKVNGAAQYDIEGNDLAYLVGILRGIDVLFSEKNALLTVTLPCESILLYLAGMSKAPPWYIRILYPSDL